MALDVALFIPARMASQRLPDKPLVPIRGADGVARPLIWHCWETVKGIPGLGSVHILTDSDTLAEVAREFGAAVLMTSEAARNGSERCAEALAQLGRRPDVVVNLQGDAFLTPPAMVTALIAAFADKDVDVATPVFRARGAVLARLEEDQAAGRIGGTTAVMADTGWALYFSKSILPSALRRSDGETEWPVYHHVGLYAYRPKALEQYAALPPGRLETAEGLEQLRFLENGMSIRCVEVDAPESDFWEVNNPGDVEVVEAILAARPGP